MVVDILGIADLVGDIQADFSRRVLLSSDRLHDFLCSYQVDRSFHVVGQNLQAHLGTDLRYRSRQEVSRAHPRLDGAERVFDR